MVDRPSDVPFTPEEVAKIREGMRKGHNAPPCPRCGVKLTEGVPLGGGSVGFYWVYRCQPCKRGMAISDIRG